VEPEPGTACELSLFLDPDGPPVQQGTLGAGLVSATYVMDAPGRLWYQITSSNPAGYDLLQEITDPPGPCQPDRFEPNESAAAATAVDPGVLTWLRLCGQQDTDAFQIYLSVFETLTVTTGNAGVTGYGDITILGPDGVTTLVHALDFGSGVTTSVLAETPGTYTVLVVPYAVTDRLTYDLALQVDGG